MKPYRSHSSKATWLLAFQAQERMRCFQPSQWKSLREHIERPLTLETKTSQRIATQFELFEATTTCFWW